MDAKRLVWQLLDTSCECDWGAGTFVDLGKLGPSDESWLFVNMVESQDVFLAPDNPSIPVPLSTGYRRLIVRFKVINLGLGPVLPPVGVNGAYIDEPGIAFTCVRLVDAAGRSLPANADATNEYRRQEPQLDDPTVPVPADSNATYALVFDVPPKALGLALMIGGRGQPWQIGSPVISDLSS